MKIIHGRRQTGRTTQLIQLCAEAEKRGEVSYIVTIDHQEAWRISQEAVALGLSIGFPLTFDEFLKHEWAGKYIKNFFIDNADQLLRRMASPSTLAAIVMERQDDE